ncbi:hypothetical protein HIM_12199 [Hirsutella minnesotensis 3608]|uniref:Uncharacterized protein n=1 Tax=Hirsutella minnesotensis 3608 TaxID=1043627 RepID=A0A0F7ZF27_9HYPO|nr:hypothetical protein HIM_12199 [Hirsutella minnesotensis 3608]
MERLSFDYLVLSAEPLITSSPLRDYRYSTLDPSHKSFRLARLLPPKPSINGLPVPETQIRCAALHQRPPALSCMKLFDTRKSRRVADLIVAENKLPEQGVALKRAIPATTATAHAASDPDTLEELKERVAQVVATPTGLSVLPLERQQGVEDSRSSFAAL